MAACSSGVARPAVSSITETRYCISDHLLWYGVPLVGGLSPLLRTHLPRSDTASRTSFKIFWYAGCERSDSSKPWLGTCAGRGAAGGFRSVAPHPGLPMAGLRPFGGEFERHVFQSVAYCGRPAGR